MIKGTEILNNFIEQYKTNWHDAIDNMKNYYDNEDEYWWIIQELLDKNIELQEQLKDIKFYIEQSDIKNMLWGKEILKIIGDDKNENND